MHEYMMHAYRSLATLNGDDGTKQNQGQLVLDQQHVTMDEQPNVIHGVRAKHGIIRRVITGVFKEESQNISDSSCFFLFLQQKVCNNKVLNLQL